MQVIMFQSQLHVKQSYCTGNYIILLIYMQKIPYSDHQIHFLKILYIKNI